MSFRVPEDWIVSPVPHRTDVESWVEVEREKWVTEGYVQLCLVPGENEKPLSLFIKVKGYNKRLTAENWLLKKRESINGKKGETLEDFGFINVNGHKASYLTYKKLRKKFLIFGGEERDRVLEVFVKCDKTGRTMFFEVLSEIPGYLDEKESLNKLLRVFSTFTCH